MNRELTNRIRFVLEDIVPPILHDSRLFRGMASLFWGKHITDLADFRERAPFLTEAEYAKLYAEHPRVHEGSDNSKACIAAITENVIGQSICDVGCGTGFLVNHIKSQRPEISRAVGVDFVVDDAEALPDVEYVASKIETMPFADGEFDTVICTHVIEHILEYKKAIAELRRITAKRLIIVVPREREYKYTFNPHFNFFPYTYSFLRAMHPVPSTYKCIDIQRDIFYVEDMIGQTDLEEIRA